MRENRPGAPAGHPPATADRPAETAVADPPAAPRESQRESAVPATEAAPETEPAGTPSAELPRRVRGVNGARPPAQVERPVFSEEFVERFHAAVAASQARDWEEERATQNGTSVPGVEHQDSAPAGESQPAAGRSLFVPAQISGNDNSEPSDPMLADSLTLMALRERTDAAEANTEPIPVVSSALSVPAQDSADLGAGPRESPVQPPAGDREAEPPQPPGPAPSRPAPGGHRSGRNAARPSPTAAGAAASQAVGQQTGTGKDGHWRYVLVGSVITVLILAVAAGSFVALRGHRPARHSALISSARLPMPVRNGAGSWVASQVGASATVACDPVMCRVLQTHGMAAARLRVLWPGSENVSGAQVFVATPMLQAQLGARLESVYAPAVIARFGSGDRQIVIRAAASHAGSAYRSALAGDLSDRQAAGSELASQVAALMSRGERAELAAGQVDERLMIFLADLESKRPVEISAFGDGSPGVGTDTAPLRSVDLRGSDQASKQAILAAIGDVGRDPHVGSANVATVRLPGGETVLQVEYPAPSPLGLFDH